MAFRAADVIGLIWSHPIVSVVVLLLFTPPLFPIVVYFSPLLISTALAVLALISMGSDVDETPSSSYSNDSHYKRGWIEDEADDGPQLENERVSKRLRPSSKDESWFDKVKNWEGTGRAWVESVLSQETRKSFGSDDSAGTKDEAVPALETVREFVTDEKKKPSDSRDTQEIVKDPARSISSDLACDAPLQKSDVVADQQDPAPVAEGNTDDVSEIIPELESEEDLLELASRNILPSPLFRGRSLPKSDSSNSGPQAEANVANSKDINGLASSDSGSEQREDSELGKDTAVVPDSGCEEAASAAAPDEQVNGNVNAENFTTLPSETDLKTAIEASKIIAASLQSESVVKDANSGSKSVRRNGGTDRNLEGEGPAEKSRGISDAPTGTPKSAAEALAPFRQWKGNSQGTPSAAVALSEKLQVPLEDIMSLLAGDDKENVSSGSPAVKASSSSETTTSQEEEWSSSDDESPVPIESVFGPSIEKKDS